VISSCIHPYVPVKNARRCKVADSAIFNWQNPDCPPGSLGLLQAEDSLKSSSSEDMLVFIGIPWGKCEIREKLLTAADG